MPVTEVSFSQRCHHLVKTFYTGVGGWADRQLPDGTGNLLRYPLTVSARAARQWRARDS
jgi:hypothetical protein